MLTYLSTTHFGPSGPQEFKIEELVGKLIDVGNAVKDREEDKKNSIPFEEFDCPTCNKIISDTTDHNRELNREKAPDPGYKPIKKN